MNKLLLIALVCLCAACGLPNRVHEKLDISRFNTEQKNGVAKVTLEKGIIAEQSKSPDGGYIQKSIHPSYFNYPSFNGIVIYKEFYNTGELKRLGPIFYGDFYGTHKIYGKDGRAIKEKEINFETPYKLSLYYIRNIVKKQFKADIFKGGIPVSRSADAYPPVYKIILPIQDNLAQKRFVTIDANTGSIISNVIK